RVPSAITSTAGAVRAYGLRSTTCCAAACARPRAAPRSRPPPFRDSQSAQGTRTSGRKGYDAGQKVPGTKRHVLADTRGLLLGVVVHPATIQARDGARLVWSQARGRSPTLRRIWADGGYAGKLIAWVQVVCGGVLEVVKRSDRVRGWGLRPRRWVVERTFGGWSQCPAAGGGYEVHPGTSGDPIPVTRVQRMRRRPT